ncbi:MAG TPA: class I SAM-dependent methyltransferase [Casimicrobiaceae bacterium]|nr:class I SAM-dependent methyltransferase [Casimicrobiaceae bacterium]
MSETLRTSYDEVPYQSVPFAQTHPDRLATLGRLFGLDPPPIDRCRVLEIGCSVGGNLIPMAEVLPHSEFIGIDFSAVQISQAAAEVSALGFANVRLLNMDIREFGDAFGSFDYIIAHGVYSWVPNEVQEKLLEICARQLAPNGIAYVSYNTLPGWALRGLVRDAMLYQSRRFSDPKMRVEQARAVLDFLADSLKRSTSPYCTMLLEEAHFVRQQPDYYIFHDHLEEVNEPLYFHQFMERAARHGLRYLAEAEFRSMVPRDLSPEAQQTFKQAALDLMQREQLMDFLRNRTFRQTLLVKQATSLTRNLSPERLFALSVATRAKPLNEAPDERSTATEEFRAPDGSALTTQRPLTKAAMVALAQNSPAAIPFGELCHLAKARLGAPGPTVAAEMATLASDLLQCFSVGVVELHSGASPFVVEPGDQPRASAFARLHATRGARVTNLRHESVDLDEDARRLLDLLDGTRPHEVLAALTSPAESPAAARAKLQPALSQLARQALLVS